MSNRFDFESYPNYQLFKNNIGSRPARGDINKKSSQIQVQQVVTEKSLSTVIEFSMPFPIKYSALELIDTSTNIKDMSSYILKDTVLISGYVHKRISYVCFEGSYKYSDSDIVKESTVGNIKVLCADIPFSCSVRVDEILPDDKINIEYAGADSSNIIDILGAPIVMTQGRVTLFKKINEKLILDISFTVLRTIQTKL